MTTITTANTPDHPDARSVAFSTRAFILSHGKEPRGRGSWAFCPVRFETAANYLEFTVFTAGQITFAEAKRLAKHYFAARGEGYIAVMP